ncbi:MAG: class I SAM-dependent methyltransferase [Rubricoccaceae bacterium]
MVREQTGPGTPGEHPTAPLASGVRRGLRARLFAWGLSRAEDSQRRLYGEHRARLFATLSEVASPPTVVEIGAGAGPTAAYLPAGTRWIAVEPNVHFHPHLQSAADTHGLELTIHGASAEMLPLADASADAVISTLVLCSVDDVPGALVEIHRVLKPGGRFLFIEHVGAPHGTWHRRIQRAVRRPWGWAADGCRPDRDTADAIRAAGFASVELATFRVPLGLASPHIRGVAVR